MFDVRLFFPPPIPKLGRMRLPLALLLLTLAAAPATRPIGFPGIAIDRDARQVRVACEVIDVKMPLEFFCVVKGGNEYESVLRTVAKPSDLHTALLILGLTPGGPATYSDTLKRALPPTGSPLRIDVEYQKDGRTVRVPATRFVRDVKTKKPMPPMNWVFTGSKVLTDGETAGRYAADLTGYVVSLVNFEMTPIDIPQVASSANETLEWEINPDTAPPPGTAVTMLIEPVGEGPNPAAAPPTRPAAAPATRPAAESDGPPDLDALRRQWERAVLPESAALRKAAQTHYDVINDLRARQQKLIDEADGIQRLIDQLDREYQDLTTPRPEPATRPS